MSQVEQDLPAGGFSLPPEVIVILAIVWLAFYMRRPDRVAENDLSWTVIPWIATIVTTLVVVAVRSAS